MDDTVRKSRLEQLLASVRTVDALSWIPPDPAERYKTASPMVYQERVDMFFAFHQVWIPNNVLYPCCDLDISPVKGFPLSKHVVLIEKNEHAVDCLRRNGVLNVLCGDIKEYRPNLRHDLLILLNPVIKTAEVAGLIVRNGFIIANDYHGNAAEMLCSPEFYSPLCTIVNGGPGSSGVRLQHGVSRDHLCKHVDDLYVFRKKI